MLLRVQNVQNKELRSDILLKNKNRCSTQNTSSIYDILL